MSRPLSKRIRFAVFKRDLYGETSTTHERFGSVKRFLERLPYEEVVDAARLSRANMSRFGQARKFKYFCAVCWNKIGPPDE